MGPSMRLMGRPTTWIVFVQMKKCDYGVALGTGIAWLVPSGSVCVFFFFTVVPFIRENADSAFG